MKDKKHSSDKRGESEEYKRFEETARKIFNVPKKDVDRRLEQEKREREKDRPDDKKSK